MPMQKKEKKVTVMIVALTTCVCILTAGSALGVVNVLNFKVISRYYGDRFDGNSDYRKDLVNGELVDLSDEQSLIVAEIVADKLLELENISTQLAKDNKETTSPPRLELRNIIFNLNRYCLKIQGYKTNDGKLFAYVNGFPMTNIFGEQEYESIPEMIPGFDDGGSQYWQAYVNLASRATDIVFNSGF